MDWEGAYERAGLWPIAVELPLNDVVYLLWYQCRKDYSRVVTTGGRAVIVSDLRSISGLLNDSPSIGVGDLGWDAVRRLAGVVAGEVPEEETIPRRLLGQSLEWLQTVPIRPTGDQVEELLNCLDLVSEWHRTLRELNLVTRWPSVIDGVASVLAESVIWGSITPAAAFERVCFLGIWPILERLVAELMQHTVMLSYHSPAA
jgi:hypothetical protein